MDGGGGGSVEGGPLFWITESATHGNGSTISRRERRGELDIWRGAFRTACLLLSPVVLKRRGDSLFASWGKGAGLSLGVLVAQGVHVALCSPPRALQGKLTQGACGEPVCL